MNKEELLNELYKLNRFEVSVEVLDFMSKTTVKLNHVLALVEQLDEPEKLTIPQFVADWIGEAKKCGYSISDSMGHMTFYDDTTQYDKAMRWAKKNQDIFARAWLDGYEVGKEKLYYVVSSDNLTMLYKDNGITVKSSHGYILSQISQNRFENKSNYQLTEKEIKDYDDRYWAFAVEVTE